jgi:hypothetical protein
VLIDGEIKEGAIAEEVLYINLIFFHMVEGEPFCIGWGYKQHVIKVDF